MFDNLDSADLLDQLGEERKKLPHDRTEEARRVVIRQMIDELVRRGVYPAETVEANPNDIYTMVDGWGPTWHLWREPLACPHCGADLRDHRVGPPFKREIGRYDQAKDRTSGLFCPDCTENLQATLILDPIPARSSRP